MTHDEVVRAIREKGFAARELLASPAYQMILNDISEFHLTAMVETQMGSLGQADRDRHHTQLHALRDLHASIESYVVALQEVEAAQAEDEDPESE